MPGVVVVVVAAWAKVKAASAWVRDAVVAVETSLDLVPEVIASARNVEKRFPMLPVSAAWI